MPGVKRTRAQLSSKKEPKAKSDAKEQATNAKKNKRDLKADAKSQQKDPEPVKDDGIVEVKTSASNGVLVDHLVPNPQSYTVVKSNNQILNAHLVFADWGHNNNKFYIIQGLHSSGSYYLWTRWGRVGVNGMNSLILIGQYEPQLFSIYHKKLREKTSKGYTAIEISYDDVKEETTTAESKKDKAKNEIASKLDPKVQDLMNFIFNMKLIEQSIVKVGYNPKKLPLGKLSKDTITKGYSALKEIEKELDGKTSNDKLSQLSSEFYRYIPHDFKFQNMSNFIINTKDKLKEKLDLIDSLRDIRITAEITDAVDKDKDKTHELDLKYTKLNWKIEPLDPSSKEYQTLVQTLDINHSSTDYPKIKWLEIFKLWREGEAEKFKKDIGNRKLLWHGSTFSNWGGILSQGLRIAPPEAPAWGYMFGKGVYFADVIYKSAGYTRYGLSNNIGLLALCDVAIGKTNDQINGDSTITLNNLPKGTNTTRGCGRYVLSLIRK